MAHGLGLILQPELLDFGRDVHHVHALACQYQPEPLSLGPQTGAGFQYRQNVLFPVHLTHEQNQRIISQVPSAGYLRHILRRRGAERCSVGHYLNFPFKAVFPQNVRCAFSHSPDLIAAVIEINHQFDPGLGDGFGLRCLQKIVIVFRMERGNQRQLAQMRQPQRFGTGHERAVRVHDIQRNHANPLTVMSVQHRLADFVLFHARKASAHKFNQLKREASLISRIVHRRHNRDLMSHPAQCLRISQRYPAHTVHDR